MRLARLNAWKVEKCAVEVTNYDDQWRIIGEEKRKVERHEYEDDEEDMGIEAREKGY